MSYAALMAESKRQTAAQEQKLQAALEAQRRKVEQQRKAQEEQDRKDKEEEQRRRIEVESGYTYWWRPIGRDGGNTQEVGLYEPVREGSFEYEEGGQLGYPATASDNDGKSSLDQRYLEVCSVSFLV